MLQPDDYWRNLMESIEAKTRYSSFIENMIEHAFISEIMQEAWIRNENTIEVLRSEVDDSGYDIVLSYGNITRFIQLKTSEQDGKTSKQKLNLSLSKRENGCIVWIVRSIDTSTMRFKFRYRFFGSRIGGEFPDVSSYNISRHSKADSKGEKKERGNFRDVPKGEFAEIENISELFSWLFHISR